MKDKELIARVTNHLRDLADKINGGDVEIIGFDVQMRSQDVDHSSGAVASLYNGLMTLRVQTREVEK